ncbi:MAG TPA: NAD-dependent epimerase/dehydratase family protein [Gemmatimonadaceae bacterium]|nr:NAD-dependent epimerase/dehydratase family protein [Gemmatimonadaceae bacterium]
MPRALVTGATGLVGSYIVDRLAADGWSVRALVRASHNDLPRRDVEPVVGDILDVGAFAKAANGCDTIFHAAAAVTPRGGWEAYRRPNVDGARNAIVAAEGSGARLLQVSSVAVYGPEGRFRGAGQRTDESTPLAPLPERAYYARSKRESEELVLAAHAAGRIWATAVRPTVIYGRHDRQFVPRMARLLSRGVAPIIGGGGATFAIVHAANVAQGAVLAATNDSAGGRAYNIANDGDVSVRRFFELAARGMGRRVRLVPIPMWAARSGFAALRFVARHLTGGRMSVLSNASLSFLTESDPFSSDRARQELGWSPVVRPEEGIPDAFRWWSEHAVR